jgi:erythromycin esterase
MRRSLSLLLLSILVLSAPTADAARRRAVRVPSSSVPATSEGQWLYVNGKTVTSVEPVPYIHDLEPLRAMVGSAGIVALGDATHGTHEFATSKHRIIEFLVREMNFDVVTFEAPYPIMNRIDAYIQGGAGDPRQYLKYLGDRLSFFWDTEEMLALVEWARQYNATRGDRPALHFAGMDIYDVRGAAEQVVEYLRVADPAYAATAEAEYACQPHPPGRATDACQASAVAIRDNIAAREAELVSRSSAAAYAEALFAAENLLQARVVNPYMRDEHMLDNVLWLREHRSTTRKMIVWAHNAHIAEIGSTFYARPMGEQLARQLGDDYFSIATLAGSGSFLMWDRNPDTGVFSPTLRTFAALTPEHFETLLRHRNTSAFLLPLNGTRPDFFPLRANHNAAGTAVVAGDSHISGNAPLWDQYDALLYIDVTTPLRLLQH